MVGVTAAAATVFFSFMAGHRGDRRRGSARPDPQRPKGILAALVIGGLFYMLVAVAAIGAQPAKMFEGQEAGPGGGSCRRHGQDLACIGTGRPAQ